MNIFNQNEYDQMDTNGDDELSIPDIPFMQPKFKGKFLEQTKFIIISPCYDKIIMNTTTEQKSYSALTDGESLIKFQHPRKSSQQLSLSPYYKWAERVVKQPNYYLNQYHPNSMKLNDWKQTQRKNHNVFKDFQEKTSGFSDKKIENYSLTLKPMKKKL